MDGNGNGRMVRIDRGGQLLSQEAFLAVEMARMQIAAEGQKMNALLGPVAQAIGAFMDVQRPGAIRVASRMAVMTPTGPFEGTFEISIEVGYGG